MNKPKLQTRFFAAYLLMALAMVGLFSVFFYRYTSNILIERETNAILDLTSSIVSQAEKGIENMDNVSVNINYSTLIKDKLNSSFDIAYYSDDFTDLAQLLFAISGADLKVDQTNLYDFQGNMISVGRSTRTYQRDITQSQWYEKTLELEGSKLLTPPYYTDTLSGSSGTGDWYISLYRTYKNRYGRLIGITETVKACRSIFKDISLFERNNLNRKIYIYNADGVLIYPYDQNENTLPAYDYMALLDRSVDHQTLEMTDDSDSLLLTHTLSSYTKWTYVVVQPQDVLLAPVKNLFRILLIVVALMSVLSIAISYYLSYGLTKPIKQLGEIIRETELDTLGSQNTKQLEPSFQEFSQLISAFENMSINLKVSMDETLEARQQELKSRSLAMQSQINPHFYYNTLSSIIVLAENEQSADIVTMCRNLTSIMRYITKSTSPLVFLHEEIDYIEKYLYCMKVRYQDSLNYEIAIDEKLINIKVPKLIIQPLVENALKYGTDCIPPWSISVKSTVKDDQWFIEVIDSGNGFTPEAISLIDQRIARSHEHIGMPEIEINGMGLLNVYTRWYLHCQEQTIFEYGNTSDGHGWIKIGRLLSEIDLEE